MEAEALWTKLGVKPVPGRSSQVRAGCGYCGGWRIDLRWRVHADGDEELLNFDVQKALEEAKADNEAIEKRAAGGVSRARQGRGDAIGSMFNSFRVTRLRAQPRARAASDAGAGAGVGDSAVDTGDGDASELEAALAAVETAGQDVPHPLDGMVTVMGDTGDERKAAVAIVDEPIDDGDELSADSIVESDESGDDADVAAEESERADSASQSSSTDASGTSGEEDGEVVSPTPAQSSSRRSGKRKTGGARGRTRRFTVRVSGAHARRGQPVTASEVKAIDLALRQYGAVPVEVAQRLTKEHEARQPHLLTPRRSKNDEETRHGLLTADTSQPSSPSARQASSNSGTNGTTSDVAPSTPPHRASVAARQAAAERLGLGPKCVWAEDAGWGIAPTFPLMVSRKVRRPDSEVLLLASAVLGAALDAVLKSRASARGNLKMSCTVGAHTVAAGALVKAVVALWGLRRFVGQSVGLEPERVGTLPASKEQQVSPCTSRQLGTSAKRPALTGVAGCSVCGDMDAQGHSGSGMGIAGTEAWLGPATGCPVVACDKSAGNDVAAAHVDTHAQAWA